MIRKLGLVAECLTSTDGYGALDLIAEAGFNCTFTNEISGAVVEKLKNKADKLGLAVEFIHAPFDNINALWRNGGDYRPVYKRIITAIDSASACGIDSVITHVSSSFTPPEVCDLGLKRFDNIVDYAAKKGVNIAFENLRKTGNLSYLMDRYAKCDNVVFCYDVGHEHCYTVTVDWLGICGNRARHTHFHDNYGRDIDDLNCNPDYHLLPFDGNIDYNDVMARLDKCGYNGSIMLEVFSSAYPIMTAREFIVAAYDRAVKLNALSKK